MKDSGVVLFFYPRANTPGCTKQACGFRDEYKKFQDAGYKVFGMSADKPKSQLNWKTKYSLPYSFLCDPDFKVGSATACFASAVSGGPELHAGVTAATAAAYHVIVVHLRLIPGSHCGPLHTQPGPVTALQLDNGQCTADKSRVIRSFHHDVQVAH